MLKALIFGAVLLAAGAAEAKELSAKYTVTEWQCMGCAKKSEKALKQITGVKSATADLEKKELVVVYDDTKVKEPEIAAAVKKLKFDCE